jgi:hypothetical protein
VRLYGVLGEDQRLPGSERTQLRGNIRTRLVRVGQQLKQQVAHAKKHPQLALPAIDLGGRPDILAQQLGPVPQLGQPVPAAEALSEPLMNLIRATIAPGSWDDDAGGAPAILAQQFGQQLGQQFGLGGANAGFGAGQNAGQQGGADKADFGQDLLELIEHTIAPDTWESNGGLGTIVYFAPMKVMVIRQTDEVHDGLGGLIDALRK